MDQRARQGGQTWGWVAVAAILGMAAAATAFAAARRRASQLGDVDRLMDACDRAADALEQAVLGRSYSHRNA